MRHVVLLTGAVETPDEAGAIRAYVERLGHRGFACRVLCPSWTAPTRAGVDLEECRGLSGPWALTWALRGLRRHDGPTRPLLIHTLRAALAPAALELAERWGVPYLLGIDDFLPPGSRLRMSRRWCRGLVAASQDLADDLVRSLGVPRDWVRVVPRGLGPAEPVVARWAFDRDQVPVVGSAGALAPGSGFSTFLNAARRVLDAGVDAEFVLLGDGEEEADLRRRADRLRLTDRLTFAGAASAGLSFWDVLDVYCQPANVPSVGRDLARAMAHGLPAVASDIEGLRTLVIHGATGLRVPPGDTHALARAILDLLADRPRSAGLGLAAREAVLRDYDLDREAGTLSQLYDEII